MAPVEDDEDEACVFSGWKGVEEAVEEEETCPATAVDEAWHCDALTKLTVQPRCSVPVRAAQMVGAVAHSPLHDIALPQHVDALFNSVAPASIAAWLEGLQEEGCGGVA